MPLPSEEQMRAEFHQMNSEIAEIERRTSPLRKKYDDLRAQECAFHDKNIAPVIEQLKIAEAQLFSLQQARARYSRALGGRVGEPAAAN